MSMFQNTKTSLLICVLASAVLLTPVFAQIQSVAETREELLKKENTDASKLNTNAMVKLLMEDNDQDVRFWSIYYLARMGYKDQVDTLLTVAGEGSSLSGWALENISVALPRLDNPSELEKRATDLASALLRYSRSDTIKYSAAMYCFHAKAVPATAALADTLDQTPTEATRWAVLRALARIDTPQSRVALDGEEKRISGQLDELRQIRRDKGAISPQFPNFDKQ